MEIARRIQRVVVECDDPPAIAAAFSRTLGLPVVEPFRPRGTYASTLLDAGDAFVEVARIGPPVAHPSRRARLFGIALEPSLPLAAAVRELDARGIAHGAPAHHPHDGELRRWTNVLLHDLIRGGLVFLCEYAPGNEPSLADSSGRAARLDEIVIQTRDVAHASARWQRLLAPAPMEPPASSTLASGPSLRIVRGGTDSIASITFTAPSFRELDAHLGADAVRLDDGSLAILPGMFAGKAVRVRPFTSA